ncbi:MAG: carboxypeptidase regulatory-like domain-containing protein [Planctomycetota bacterium]
MSIYFDEFLARVIPIGVDAALKSTLILMLAALVAASARRASAATRHRLWSLALTSCLLVPIAPFLLPKIQLPILPPTSKVVLSSVADRAGVSSRPSDQGQARRLLAMDRQGLPPMDAAQIPDEGFSRRERSTGISRPENMADRPASLNNAALVRPWGLMSLALFGVWCCGLILLWGCLGLAIVDIRRRIGNSATAPAVWLSSLGDVVSRLRVSRSVRIVCDMKATMPLATGVFFPAVLMPVDAGKWSLEGRRYALLHELAHIERRDVLWQLLGQLAVGLYWFNPLAWYAIRRLRIEREWACDDRVVALTGLATDYATQLVEIARSARAQNPMVPAVAMAQASDLEQRLRAMFDRARSHLPLSRRAAMRLAMASAMLLVFVATVKPVSRVFTSEVRAQAPAEKPAVTVNEKDTATSKPNAAPATPERAKMRIKVVDESGNPIVGTKIRACIWFIDPTKPDGPANRYFTTDKDGLAILERPKELLILRIWASHPDFVSHFVGWEQKASHDDGRLLPELFTFKLPKGIEVGGQVVDPAGQPIPNVLVEVKVDDDEPVDPVHANVKIDRGIANGDDRAVTDQEGRWVVKNIPKNFDRNSINRMSLRFNHPDYLAVSSEGFDYHELPALVADPASQVVSGTGSEASRPTKTSAELRSRSLRTTLKRGIRLAGVVRDPSGKPVAGAVIARGNDPYLEHGSQEERTDAQGRYLLPALAEGKFTLVVTAPGWAPQMREIDLTSIANQADFQLEKGHLLKLKFVDQSGQPLSKCYVSIDNWRGKKTLYNHKHPNVLETGIPSRSDVAGNYVWDWAPENAVTYSIGARGYIQQLLTLGPTDSGPEKVITLLHDAKITGNVTDSKTGKPIPKFSVQSMIIFGENHHIQDWNASAEVVDGHYSAKMDRNDYPYFLLIKADGYRSAKGRPFNINDGDHHEDFSLEPAPAIAGRVLNAQGNPVADANVHLVTVTTPLQYDNDSEFLGSAPVVTGASGHFQLVPQAGPYTLIATHPDGYYRVDLDQDAQPGDLQLQPWAKIEGTLWQEGHPVRGASVFVTAIPRKNGDRSFLREEREALTNDVGRFWFASIPPTRVVLRPALSPFSKNPLSSSRAIPLDLKPGQKLAVDLGGEGARITGRVKLQGDVPEDFDLNYSLNYLVRRGSALPPGPELQATADAVQQQGWTEAIWRSTAGDDYMNLHERHLARLKTGGEFLINGVQPGEYDFALSIYDRPEGCLTDPIAVKFVPVTVTPADVTAGRLTLPDIAIPFPERTKVGDVLPAITLAVPEGESLKLSELRGKPLLLHGWATWCQPCVKSLPELKAFRARFPADQLMIVGINLDEQQKSAQEFVQKQKLTWIQAYVGDKSEVSRRLGMSSAPTYLVVSAEGKLVSRTSDWEAAAKELEKLLVR